jgi:hypothetical protein
MNHVPVFGAMITKAAISTIVPPIPSRTAHMHDGKHHHALERHERATMLIQFLRGGRLEIDNSHRLLPRVAYRVAATVSTRRPAARTTIHRAPELPPR